MGLTAKEEAELAALEAEEAAGGFSSAEEQELAALEAELGGAKPAEPSKLRTAIDMALRGLDYAGGMARTAAVSGTDVFRDKPLVTDKDWEQAKVGLAPRIKDYLERSGVEAGTSWSDLAPGLYSETGDEWLKFKKGGTLDPNERDVAGFIGDVALDPLTYASGGASALAKLKVSGKTGQAINVADKVLNPLKNISESQGKNLYKSAFKNVDKDLEHMGKSPISEPLLESGFTGNMQQARKANLDLQKQAGKNIEGVIDTLSANGATGSMNNATKQALEITAEMRKSPHPQVRASADKLDDIIAGYLEKGEAVPVELLQKWGSEANALAGKRAFNPLADTVPMQDQIERALGSGMKKEVRDAAERQSVDLLTELEKANATYGSAKEARKAFKREANKEVTKNPITAIDIMLAGGTAINPWSMAVLGGKKAGQAVMSTRGRTTIGKGLNDLGKNSSGIMDEMARQGLWHLMYSTKKEDEEGL